MRLKLSFALFGAALLAACAQVSAPVAPIAPAPQALPVMGWDGHPEGAEWTAATLAALRTEGAALLSEEPADIAEWCPAYLTAPTESRAYFWSGMLSALAKFESTWNPEASGGGGAWIGLVQISPQTAQAYDCPADTVAELKDGAANLECAVRIAAKTVTRDGYVGTGREGLAADWAPFLNSEKRAAMMQWTRSQSYCQG